MSDVARIGAAIEGWLAGAEATAAAGEALGRLVEGGDVIALIGDLGAGKTCFTGGLAVGAGVGAEEVASPTFALVNEYRGGRVVVLHADLYRIEQARELDEIGWDDVIGRADAVVVVEWADKFERRLPRDVLRVELAHGDREAADGRRMTVTAGGERSQRLLDRWRAVSGLASD